MYVVFVLFQLGCTTEPVKEDEVNNGVVIQDIDGDGFISEEDCNDLDGDIYPTAIDYVMVSIKIAMVK